MKTGHAVAVGLIVLALGGAGPARAAKDEPGVGQTQVGGTLFMDASQLDQSRNGVPAYHNGTSADLKRFYFDVEHRFSHVWSARILTDINWQRNQKPTDLWFKYAYLQGQFSRAFTLRAGAAPMPWIPLFNKWYGYRYIDSGLTARARVAASADWGVHALGALNESGSVQYAASIITGAGYKQPRLGDGPDYAARVSWQPVQHLVLAVGGYSGTLGQNVDGQQAFHTARRWSAMVAYADSRWRGGAQYFRAVNFTQVLSPQRDRSHGWSAWASVQLAPKLALFARHDRVVPSALQHPQRADVYDNVGVEWRAQSWLRLAGVYKHERLSDNRQSLKEANEVGVYAQISY